MNHQGPSLSLEWSTLVHDERLVLLTELDGTIVPFAETAEVAELDEDGARTLRALIESGVRVVVVSGRPQPLVDRLRSKVPGAWWVAEHGGWRFGGDEWRCVTAKESDLEALVDGLTVIASMGTGARVERKTASVCLHWRSVPDAQRRELLDAAELAIDEWLESHADYDRLAGVEMLEVGPRARHKGSAVAWVRENLTAARIIALGDDVTDEHMFAALAPGDAAIAVGPDWKRRSHAPLYVDDVGGARRFLRWLVEARTSRDLLPPAPVEHRATRQTPRPRTAFLVLSNRMPCIEGADRRREVGGLVAALEPALRDRGGIWLGWSGQEREGDVDVSVNDDSRLVQATFDLPERWRRLFYAGFCNRALWPLLHGFPGRVRYEDDEWAAYVEANDAYARMATDLVQPSGTIWVHDYQLLLVAAALRHRGHRGRIGLFVHVPFPPLDLFATLPWSHQVLDAMMSFDLIGFHTEQWAHNFACTVRGVLAVSKAPDAFHHRRGATRIATFPLGVDAEPLRYDLAVSPSAEVEALRGRLGDRKLLLGVDRLDYSKGIPERLEAFERLLVRHPRWVGRVSFVQVSVPSRADVPEYAELRQRVEHLVGRINGRFGDADWVPVQYLYRSYDHEVLAQLYRAADVGVVTPLRDGMNLVAKEFVAAQDPSSPGVLVLSQFAGAAQELRAAVLTNPFHRDGLADDLDRALSIPTEERRARLEALRAAVLATTPTTWADDFLAALGRCRSPR